MPDWLKIESTLPAHPKVFRMVAALGNRLDRFSVAGRLITVWAWVGSHSADGQHLPATSATVDSLAETPGFAEAMRVVNWLFGRDGDLSFPKWDSHNSGCAKARTLEAEAKRLRRQSMSDNMSDTCPTKTGKNVRPEERRGEKSTSTLPKAPPPEREAAKGVGEEVPTEAQALAQIAAAGIPDDFARMAFADWHSRGGRDGAGVLTRWPGYVAKRWRREEAEWKAGTHRSQRNGSTQRPSAGNADRNHGTANAGKSAQYARAGKVQ